MDNAQVPAIATRRSANIRGLVAGGRGLPIVGHIKIGKKGPKQKSQSGNEFQRPVRLKNFLVTTLERDAEENYVRDEAMHKLIGDEPTEIAIRLPYNGLDLNFQSRYGVFDGRSPWCTGDGETAIRLKYDFGRKPAQGTSIGKEEVACPCYRADPDYQINGKTPADKCKWHGKLLCIIENASVVGGVWDLRTTSYHTTNNLYASLDFLRTATGGRLAGVPLWLRFGTQSGFTPQGQSTTFPVITCVFKGSIAQLQEETVSMLSSRREYFAGIAAIEAQVQKLGPALLLEDDSDEENADTAAEFHPESQPGAETVDPTTGEVSTATAEKPKATRKAKSKEETPASVTTQTETGKATPAVAEGPTGTPAEPKVADKKAPPIDLFN